MLYYNYTLLLINLLLCVLPSMTQDSIKIREKRIVDGKLTKINKYPFQVAILYDNYFICSGSIISNKHILTAAHCFDDDNDIFDLIVRAGSSNNIKGGFISKVKEIIVHEKYNSITLDYDIGLMILKGKGFYNEINKGYIIPINLPKKSPFQMKPKLYYAYLAGWGALNETNDSVQLLRETKLQLISQKACKILNEGITERMFCAGYIEGGRDACTGDSGGPLIINKNIIIGIVSWGEGCGRPLLPSVFTHVFFLRKWIYQHW